MNCETFNDHLPEYLDGTSPAPEQVAARDHVENCAACQLALARQEAFAKSLEFSFNRQVQRLSLSAKTRQNILDALKQRDLEPAISWTRLVAYLRVPWWKPACLVLAFLCLFLLVFESSFRMPLGRSSSLSTLETMARKTRDTYVVDVPIQTEVHLFRRQNGSVIDAVVTDAGNIDANLSGSLPHPLH